MLRFLRVFALASLAPIAALAACGTTAATTTIPPITGIIISSQDLVAGLGCGTGPNQVYKYGAIVIFPTDAGLALPTNEVAVQNVFPCFSDGQFANLPVSTLVNVGTQFYITIFAYNQSAYLAQQSTIDGDVLSTPIPGTNTPPTQLMDINGGSSLFATTKPTWSTTCTAPVTLNVQSLAACAPLVPYVIADGGAPEGGSDASTPDAGGPDATFGDSGTTLDGSSDAEAGASTSDGGGDASAADASDAGDASALDASDAGDASSTD